MSDQKKLRELMKKEKEQRAAKAGGARPALKGAGVPPALALAKARAAAAAAAPAASTSGAAAVAAASTSPPGADADSGSGGGSSSSSSRAPAVEAPGAKKPRTAADADALGTTSAAADALAMPPPPVPAAAARIKREADAAVGGSAGKEGAVKVEARKSVALVDYNDDAISVAASEDSRKEEAEEEAAEGENGEAIKALIPEGFFDNPDDDAKVRGVEAPSIRHQRELEEGLKRFEKEIGVEAEKAEETRHELDEEKYEKTFAEEQEFQSKLQGRLEELRLRAATTMEHKRREAAAVAAAARNDASEGGANEDAGSVHEDSGSDIEFDWRSKDFG